MALTKHSERTIRKGCNRCGRTDLYWAHDDSIKAWHCDKCKSDGKLVLAEANMTRHSCQGNNSPAPVPDIKGLPDDGGFKIPGGLPESKDAAVRQLLDLLTPSLDPEQIRAIVTDAQAAFAAELMAKFDKRVAELSVPVRIEVRHDDREPKELPGVHHAILPEVLIDVKAGQNVMMVGPAGTGKSHIARQVAEALELPYGDISLNPGMTATALLGYMQATGQYVDTEYRRRYEHGGVFHFDELDNAHPSTLAVINAGIANGSMAFPDKMVKRHADFHCIASANTYGRGADRMYVGRQAIDAATLDRFTVETVDYDEQLEESLCLATGLDGSKVAKVLAYVRALRRNADNGKMPLIFGVRASVGACWLIKAGKTWNKTIDARIRKGISDADWHKVTSGVTKPVL